MVQKLIVRLGWSASCALMCQLTRPESELEFQASSLMERDATERHRYGQQLRDTFHLGDVFVDGLNITPMQQMLTRFVQAFFGRTTEHHLRSNTESMQRVPHHFALPIYQDRLAQQFFRKMARLSFRDAMKFHKHMAVLTGTPKSLTIVTSLKGIDPNEQEQREILRDLVERLRIGYFLSENKTNRQ